MTGTAGPPVLRPMQNLQRIRRDWSASTILAVVIQCDGQIWHADGGGGYRIGKGRRLAAGRIEPAVLSQLRVDLGSADTVALLRATIEALAAGGEPVDGRKMAGMERRASTLAAQIVRTIDLAAQIADPKPVLRRVADLALQRAELQAELEGLQDRKAVAQSAAAITEDEVRNLLAQLLESITAATADSELNTQARMALREVLDRIEINTNQDPPVLSLHYAVQTRVNLASPRGFEPL